MSSMFIEGLLKYPDDLPCPQIETDLQPRERRYISDIGQVKMLRRFQRDYQATRQNISFVFTPEQARDFQEWYKDSIIEGGAWFYADWPILHKETRIAYRFVTRPVWTFLALGNYHVSATVELYERKVGKVTNVYTSKIYPLLPVDALQASIPTVTSGKQAEFLDGLSVTVPSFTAQMTGYIYSDYAFDDKIAISLPVFTAQMTGYIYSDYECSDNLTVGVPAFSAKSEKWLVPYDFYSDDKITLTIPTFTGGMT